MKIFLTGASGFIGSHLAEELVEAGCSVKAVGREKSDLSCAEQAGCEIIRTDLDDISSLKKAMKGCDVVIHAAAIFNFDVPMDVMRKVNVEGTENVCKAATQAGVKKFLMFSTVGVYGRPVKVPCKEEDPKNPRNPYEITKWESEKVAFRYHKEHGLPVFAIRPTLVYGPRSRYGVIQYLCSLTSLKINYKLKKLPILKGGPKSHMVHAKDVTRAIVFLMKRDDVIGNSYNIVDESPLTVEEYFRTLLNCVGLEPKAKIPYSPFVWRKTAEFAANKGHILVKRLNKRILKDWEKIVKEHNLVRGFDPALHLDWLLYASADHYYDNSKIKALGFEFKYPKFTDELKNVVEWYRENRWLPRV